MLLASHEFKQSPHKVNGAPWHKECHATSKQATAVKRGGAAAAGPRITAGKGGGNGDGAGGTSKPADRASALRAVTGARAGGRGAGGGQGRGRSVGRSSVQGRSVASARVATLGLAMDYASLE